MESHSPLPKAVSGKPLLQKRIKMFLGNWRCLATAATLAGFRFIRSEMNSSVQCLDIHFSSSLAGKSFRLKMMMASTGCESLQPERGDRRHPAIAGLGAETHKL
ncbi:MAG: hypothetical protein ACYC2R_03730 [Burkholderiales bacterium]